MQSTISRQDLQCRESPIRAVFPDVGLAALIKTQMTKIPQKTLEEEPIHCSIPFEPKNYPHYDVQSSLYSLLLTALTVAVHFEKIPGFQERQRKLEAVMKD